MNGELSRAGLIAKFPSHGVLCPTANKYEALHAITSPWRSERIGSMYLSKRAIEFAAVHDYYSAYARGTSRDALAERDKLSGTFSLPFEKDSVGRSHSATDR